MDVGWPQWLRSSSHISLKCPSLHGGNITTDVLDWLSHPLRWAVLQPADSYALDMRIQSRNLDWTLEFPASRVSSWAEWIISADAQYSPLSADISCFEIHPFFFLEIISFIPDFKIFGILMLNEKNIEFRGQSAQK